MLADVHINTVNKPVGSTYSYSGGNGNGVFPQNGAMSYGMDNVLLTGGQQCPSAFQQQELQQPNWTHGIDQNSVWAMPPQQIQSLNGGAMQPPQQQLQQQPFEGAQNFDAAPAVGWGGQAISESRGKGARGGGRSGRNNNSHNSHRRMNDHTGSNRGGRWGSGGGNGGDYGGSGRSWDDGPAVEGILRLLQVPGRGHTHGQQMPPISQAAFEALEAFDGRRLASLLKEMSGRGMAPRAIQLFESLQHMAALGHPLGRLCDTYSYTGMVSVCIPLKDAARATALVAEMRRRGIECSVHTYTALMNAAIKSNRGAVALDAYGMMLQDGLQPNVVTFNTLIDVYGKMGNWEQALNVLSTMREMGVQPVLRTYNTLMIACNICSQPREALRLYEAMRRDEGFSPNATTFNALITAHGKAGQLDRAMEAFREMRNKSCPRSVVTYSTLISACERVGQWRRALELFAEMRPDGCVPNTVTYNSIIKACAQGGQWEKAVELFEAMGSEGCRPDVVTFTALINSVKGDKSGRWRAALDMFDRMLGCGCKPDAIVYNAVIDCLWETGVVAAQCEALALFHRAQNDGHFMHRGLTDLSRHGAASMPRLEVNLHAQTAGVAMLGLFSWLVALRQHVGKAHELQGQQLPAVLAIVTDGSGRGAREMANNVVKGAVGSMMQAWGAPFRPGGDSSSCRLLEASGPLVMDWLLSPAFDSQLPVFFPCAYSSKLSQVNVDTAEPRCREAFGAIKRFEQTHTLSLESMGMPYLEARPELVLFALKVGSRLNLAEEVIHDAVLLMDRAASTGYTQLQADSMALAMASCVKVAANRSSDAEGNHPRLDVTDLEQATGLAVEALNSSEAELYGVLGNDTASISAVRCVQVYVERIGCDFKDPESVELMLALPSRLMAEALTDASFLNCRPSIVAAGILYTSRRARGIVPYWPSVLAKMTGYGDVNAPEMAVAVKASQRLYSRITGHAFSRSSSAASDISASPFGVSPTGASPLRGSSPVMWSSTSNTPMGGSPTGFPSSRSGSFSMGPPPPPPPPPNAAASMAALNSLAAMLSAQLPPQGNSASPGLTGLSPPLGFSPPGGHSPPNGYGYSSSESGSTHRSFSRASSPPAEELPPTHNLTELSFGSLSLGPSA